MAGHALHQDDRLIELGRSNSAADRIVINFLLLAIEERRQLARMWQQDRMSAFAKLGITPLEAVQEEIIARFCRRPGVIRAGGVQI